jgi:nitrite reductase (NADH) small subunit
MLTQNNREQPLPRTDWQDICALEDILPESGVAAMVEGEQVAIFRPTLKPILYALSNFDPFSKAFVLSRGILGDRGGIPKVASPIYKQNFDLRTGDCLDDPSVKVATYAVRVVGGRVQIELGGERSSHA